MPFPRSQEFLLPILQREIHSTGKLRVCLPYILITRKTGFRAYGAEYLWKSRRSFRRQSFQLGRWQKEGKGMLNPCPMCSAIHHKLRDNCNAHFFPWAGACCVRVVGSLQGHTSVGGSTRDQA